MKSPSISIVVPVYREEKNIAKVLFFIQQKIKTLHEAIIVYDSINDPTVKIVKEYISSHKKERIHLEKNSSGDTKGVMNAIKTGFSKAKGNAVVVIMADLADDIGQVDAMYSLIQSGNDIVCASRFMRGGKKIGGPVIKTILTKIACFTLYHIFKIPTHDATNAFKMYKRSLLKSIKIESIGGFEYSLEIIIKAFKAGYKISEIPTIWKDREEGKSNFKIMSWVPQYIMWYMKLAKYSFSKNSIIQFIKNHTFFWKISIIVFIGFLTILQIGQEIKDKVILYSSLDFSWQSDAVERFLHGFIEGKDYVFTYGPLFQLVYSIPSLLLKMPSYVSVLYAPLLLNLVIGALFIWLVCSLTKNNFERILLSIFLLIVIGIGISLNGNVILRILLPMIFALVWFKTIKSKKKLVASAIPSILGLYSYDLFIQSTIIAFGISISMFLFWNKKRNYFVKIVTSFVAIIFFQLLTSLFLSHSLSYIQYSFITLQDYTYILNSPWEIGRSNYLYIFAFAMIVLYGMFLAGKEFTKEQKSIFGILVFCSFLALRIAFIRSDSGHVEMSLYASIITVFLLLFFLIKNRSISAIFMLAVLFSLNPFANNYFNSFSVKNIKSVLSTIRQKKDFFTLYQLSDHSYSQSDFVYFKDIILKNPGNVMAYPYDSYILNIYGQTYNTFPLQFYGYSNSSVEKKAVKMLSSHPPLYIILGIDGHAALALDNIPNFTRNPLLTKWLLAHYTFEKQGRTYIVLKYQSKSSVKNVEKSCLAYELHITVPKTFSLIKQPIYLYENKRLPVKPGLTNYLLISDSNNIEKVANIFSNSSSYFQQFTKQQNVTIVRKNAFTGKKTPFSVPARITCYY